MSRGCPFPEHHQSGGGGGLGQVVAVVVALVLAAAVAPAVAELAHVVAVVLSVVVIAAASVAGLAALVGLALVAVRVRRRILSGPRAAVPRRVSAVVLDGRRAAELPEPGARALPAARDDVSAYPREYADPHVVTSRAARPRCTRRGGRGS